MKDTDLHSKILGLIDPWFVADVELDTAGGQVDVHVDYAAGVIDHCSLEVVGIHAAKRGTRFEALEPIRQGIRHSFGAFGKDVAQGLTLRHDHGSQFISDDFQDEIKFLGIKDSASYVREPQGNGIAERFVRILKENLLWVRSFNTVEELRLALLAFKAAYNQQWRIGRHGYRSPAQVREQQKAEVTKAA